MLQMPILPFYQYSEDLYLLIPFIIGVLFVAILLYIKKKRSSITVIITSFILGFFLSLIGIAGSLYLSLWLKDDLNTGHVLFDGLYYGWNTSWYPLLVSGAFIIILLVVSAKILFDHKKSLPQYESLVKNKK